MGALTTGSGLRVVRRLLTVTALVLMVTVTLTPLVCIAQKPGRRSRFSQPTVSRIIAERRLEARHQA